MDQKYFKKVKKSPIQSLSTTFKEFTKLETTSGFLLIFAVIIALILANSPLSKIYDDTLHTAISFNIGEYISVNESLLHWINDGLMTLFFFLIGLEIKREILIGELNSLNHILLPLVGAFGGILGPLFIYSLFNLPGSATFFGWAVPISTDIAFSLVVLTLLGKRVPIRLKIFLTTLAIFDDIAAVIIIAVFYSENINMDYIAFSLLFFIFLLGINRLGIRRRFPYIILGFFIWYTMFLSGLHATIAGILVALTIPATIKKDLDDFTITGPSIMARIFEPGPPENSAHIHMIRLSAIETLKGELNELEAPLKQIEHSLAPWVAFVIIPIFAIANAGIHLNINTLGNIFHPVFLGVFFGLLLGKPLGITLAVLCFTKLGYAKLPYGIQIKDILGVGFIAGIGFTMAFFISNLAFKSAELLDIAKLAIIFASLIAGVVGFYILHGSLKKEK